MVAITKPRRTDVLNWPVIGRFLKWRHARLAMQIPLLLLAGWMIFDGLVGPQLAPKNLATVGVWLHYRGFVVLALLLAGNLFCMACPFMLPRRAGRWVREHWLKGGRPVPGWMRNKWVAIALLVAFFFAYEIFALWSTPWWTAWVALAYFAAALVVDTLFQGAAFCKHVCPLGQFNFFGSLVSPLEVQVRDQQVCSGCRTKDCITARRVATQPSNVSFLEGPAPAFSAPFPAALRPEKEQLKSYPLLPLAGEGGQGDEEDERTPASRPGARGCELNLFQERKAGNMDCTFCLDCIHACPYDNVGILPRTPTRELWDDPWRSGVGRFSQRTDLAALAVILIFSAFLNAFNMIPPVYEVQAALGRALQTTSRVPGLVFVFVLGLVVLPGLLLAGAAVLTRNMLRLRGRAGRLGPIVRRYIWALAPMGFAMWLAHYAFHFLTGALTVIPVMQSFLADVSLYSGAVRWDLGPLVPQSWLFPIEAALLYAGAMASIIVTVQIASRHIESLRKETKAKFGANAALAAAAPWIAITLLLLAFGIWIMLQPMEMRGTMLMAGG